MHQYWSINFDKCPILMSHGNNREGWVLCIWGLSVLISPFFCLPKMILKGIVYSKKKNEGHLTLKSYPLWFYSCWVYFNATVLRNWLCFDQVMPLFPSHSNMDYSVYRMFGQMQNTEGSMMQKTRKHPYHCQHKWTCKGRNP